MRENHTPLAVEDMLVAELSFRKLGHTLFRLPLVAQTLGHVDLRETETYLHPSTLEARFVVDVIRLAQGCDSTEAFCEKWYGGEIGAGELLKRVLGREDWRGDQREEGS